MDLIDENIIRILKEDGRISFEKIGNKIGKTEATVRRRVKILIQNNVISKFTIECKEKTKVHATIKIEPDFTNMKSIIRDLKLIPEVVDLWRLSGDCGIFLRVAMKSMNDFNALIEGKISSIEGVKIVETCFITDILKQ